MTLSEDFCARDVVTVAQDLLGRHVHLGPVTLRVTETEAYRWPGDTACHARHGQTPRTAPLFGPPGRAYVYLCYGIHQMLNLVTGPDGEAQAVLVRSVEVVAGESIVLERRNGRRARGWLAGPGKVGAALGIDTSWSGVSVVDSALTLSAGTPVTEVLVGPRVGIDFAEPAHRALPWRFADAASASVSHRRSLR